MAILKVSVTKGKDTVDIDTDTLPEAVYAEAMLQGLKVLMNRGMSKVTKEAHSGDEEAMKAAAMAVAAKNLEAIKSGDIKFSGEAKKASKVSGALRTEAMRLARNVIKDELKKAGLKISHIDASEITAAAKELLDDEAQGPSILAMAQANLEERTKVPVASSVISAIKTNPKKVAAAEAKKKEKGDTLSAKQAGKVSPRAKKAPQAQA